MAPPLRSSLLLLCLAPALAAQLDLPARPQEGAGRSPVELPSRARGSTAGGPGLDLPVPAPAAPPAEGLPAAPAAPVEPADAPALFASLEPVRAPDDPRLAPALERLRRLGGAALEPARAGLESASLGVLVASARLLLADGAPEDRQRVAARLRRDLPSAAAPPLLAALVARDPVLASPAFLAELLDHPSGAMRQAAERLLLERADPLALPYLPARLASDRSDTRLRALRVAVRTGGGAAVPLIASRLDDPTASVAKEAVRAMALENAPGVDALLRQRAFAGGLTDRGAAHALLALVEREDRRGEVAVTLDDLPELLPALRAGEPIVSGAAACALAGVGFRNPSSPATAWLDREVPHALVRLGTGAEFHRDFSTLQPIALRRLAMISGEALGEDGLSWRRWWTEAARGFHARRGVLSVESGGEEALCVELRRAGQEPLRLAGPSSPRAEEEGTLLIGPEACAHLVGVLRDEGVLGLERLPSGRREEALALAVQVGEQEKRFAFGRAQVPPWVERVAAALEAHAGEEAWQRFRDRTRHVTQRAFVADEGPWWSAARAPRERARRLCGLVLSALASLPATARAGGMAELERLYGEQAAAAEEDLPALVALAADEPQGSERFERLVALALEAAASGAQGRPGAEDTERLLELCLRRGETGVEPLARVLAAAGDERVAAAAADGRAPVRRAAARAAAGDPSPRATELLIGLLADADEDVVAAAAQGLGPRGGDAVRRALQARAADAPAGLRAPLLRAVGRAGGEGARDVLVLAMAEEDPALQLAAVEGLAELADPATAALLVSILARGRGPQWTEPARRALLRIGEPAWPQLQRVASSSKSRGQREAALLLSEQGVADALPTLITLLEIDPSDEELAEEIAVASCVDLRASPERERAWWDWWSQVVHDDARAWFRAALERAGLRAPEEAKLAAPGRGEALFLVEVATGEAIPWVLAERARRELARALGRPLDALPADAGARVRLADDLRTLVEARFAAGGEDGPR